MGKESEEALAELPAMTTSDESASGESASEDPSLDDSTRDDDEGPSAEVLAEAAAAERDAAERSARDAQASKSKSKSKSTEAPAESPVESALAEPADEASADAPATETADSNTADPGAAAQSAEEPAEGPGALLSDSELRRVICSLLFASPEALSEARLAQLAEGAPKARVKAALLQLEAELAESALPLELRKLAGGWRLMTAAEMSEVVGRLFQARKSERLSAAGLETLAVVAYRQPVTKAEIEAIRGVQCGPMLRTLVDRGLVKVTGRAELPGQPLQYGTTRDFLDRFGLGGLEELPRDGELLG